MIRDSGPAVDSAGPLGAAGGQSRDLKSPAVTGRRDAARPAAKTPRETGGPTGPEPTRYGDWERNGRCIDF
jgi:hypothetical protein